MEPALIDPLDRRVLTLELRHESIERQIAAQVTDARAQWLEIRSSITDLAAKLGSVLEEMQRERGRQEERVRFSGRVKPLLPYAVLVAIFAAEHWIKTLQ